MGQEGSRIWYVKNTVERLDVTNDPQVFPKLNMLAVTSQKWALDVGATHSKPTSGT